MTSPATAAGLGTMKRSQGRRDGVKERDSLSMSITPRREISEQWDRRANRIHNG